MELLNGILSWDWLMIFAVLWGVSEALALIPSLKSNSVFQMFYNSLKFLKDKVVPAKK